LPTGVEAIIVRALKKDKLQRFQDCQAMASAFRRQAKLLEARPEIGVASPGSRAGSTGQWAVSSFPAKPAAVAANPSATQTIRPVVPAKRSGGSKYWNIGLGAVACALIVAIVVMWMHWNPKTGGTTAEAEAGPQNHPAPSIKVREVQPRNGGASRPANSEAPVTPAVATEGEMVISSVPAGAIVEIEGRSAPSGRTPLTLSWLKPGAYKVTVSKSGYAPEVRRVEVAGGKRASVDVRLTASQGFLTVNSDPQGASILINGKDTGKISPAEFALDPAAQSIVVHKEGYLDAQTEIKLIAGQSVSYAPVLREAGRTDNIKPVGGFSIFGGRAAHGMSRVEIKTHPEGAQIIVNGDLKPKTTPVTLQIGPGNYDIRLQKEGYQPVVKSLTVNGEEKVKIEVTLAK
jgi:hypothetical protein